MLTRRKNLGRKMSTSNRDDQQAWECCEAKPIQTFGRDSQGVNWSWSQCIKSQRSDIFRKRVTKPLLKPKHRQKRLTVAKKKNNGVAQWSTESGGCVKGHRIHVSWSPVWSFHSQWWFGLPCHLLVLVHCVFWSPQSTQPSTSTF